MAELTKQQLLVRLRAKARNPSKPVYTGSDAYVSKVEEAHALADVLDNTPELNENGKLSEEVLPEAVIPHLSQAKDEDGVLQGTWDYPAFAAELNLGDAYTDADAVAANAAIVAGLQSDIAGKANTAHTQAASTITDFTEAVQDAVAAFLGQGSNITLTYDDAANTFTIAAAGGSQFDPEATRDAIGAALIGVGAISVTINDAADTITISTTATQNSTDAQLRDRSTHTGTQSADTLTDGTTNKAYTATEKTKLAGIAPAATANRTDALTDAAIATAVARPKLRANDTLLVGFDSLSDYAWSTRTGSFSNNGYGAWLNLYTGGRLNQPFSAGVGGNKTTDFLARLGVVVAARPHAFVLLGGTNDIGIAGTLPAIILANLQLAIDALLAINCKIVVVTVLPRFAPNALSAGQETYRTTLNTSLLALNGTNPNLVVVNAETAMNNAAYYEDGLHTNSTGASILGSLVATALNNWMDTSVNATKQVALDKSLTPNLLLTGTTGGKNGTATGNVATSWTLLQTNSGGATVAGSKTTDNNLNQQVITVSGTYTGNDRYVGLLSNQAIGALAVAGNTIESFLDFQVLAAMSGVATITVNTTFNGSAGYISDFYSLYNNDAQPCPLGVGRYQMRSNPMVVPVGTTSIDTHVMIRLLPAASATAVAASVKIHRAASIVIV